LFQEITLGKIHGPKPSAGIGKAIFSFWKVGLCQLCLEMLLERIYEARILHNICEFLIM